MHILYAIINTVYIIKVGIKISPMKTGGEIGEKCARDSISNSVYTSSSIIYAWMNRKGWRFQEYDINAMCVYTSYLLLANGCRVSQYRETL